MALLLFQEEILFDLAGTKCPKVKDGKSLPSYMYIGHFMKPYFKDKVTGVVSSKDPSLSSWSSVLEGRVSLLFHICEFPWVFWVKIFCPPKTTSSFDESQGSS